MEPTRSLPARIPRATPAPPTPEKVLCKRNLYANVVLLLLHRPCPRVWGHLKALSKEHLRALTRPGLPSPHALAANGPLPSNWELMFSESCRSPRTRRPPSRTGWGEVGSARQAPAGPRGACLLAFVFPGLSLCNSWRCCSFELRISKENRWGARHLEPRRAGASRGGQGIQEFPQARGLPPASFPGRLGHRGPSPGA